MVLNHAVCSVSVAPLRSAPDHREEQVSQLLFGERMEIVNTNREGWLEVITEWDNYRGWIHEGQVMKMDAKTCRKPLHYINTGTADYISMEEGRFLLSPGSSLLHLKKKAFDWNPAWQFQGKKLKLKLANHDADTIRQLAGLYLGSPYQWGGRSLMGIDCSGLTQMVYKMMNIRLPRDASQQVSAGETVDFLQHAQCGDLAFFDNEEGRITHVGIMMDNRHILHATESCGCVTTDLIDQGGIISKKLRKRTHKLRIIKRITNTSNSTVQ